MALLSVISQQSSGACSNALIDIWIVVGLFEKTCFSQQLSGSILF